MKRLLLFQKLLAFAILLLFTIAAKAVNTKTPRIQENREFSVRQFSESSNADLEKMLGKKLSWKERFVYNILKRKLKKAVQKNPALGALPFGEGFKSPCVRITLHNGEVVEAEIIEIKATRVVYRRCGRPDSPEIDISKDDVDRIEDADGRLLFEDKDEPDQSYSVVDYDQPKKDQMAVWGFVCAVAGFLFAPLFLVGLILGGISLDRIRRNPDKYRGRGLALAAVIIGGVVILLAIFIIALFAASFG